MCAKDEFCGQNGTAVACGCDVDKPRNLAMSVTVE